jgi:hypothetical protein
MLLPARELVHLPPLFYLLQDKDFPRLQKIKINPKFCFTIEKFTINLPNLAPSSERTAHEAQSAWWLSVVPMWLYAGMMKKFLLLIMALFPQPLALPFS